MIKVIFPDGVESSFEEGTTFFDVLKGHDREILKKSVAVRVDGVLKDLRRPSRAILRRPRHPTRKNSPASHVMAQAVKSLYGNVLLAIGPAIEDGFYYDFDTESPSLRRPRKDRGEDEGDSKGDYRFEGEVLSKKEALDLFAGMNEKYKEEIISELTDAAVSVYRQDNFTDLCRGPHVPSTGYVKAFKLTGTAGAYWRGSEKNKMLQRVYGTAFATKEAPTTSTG
jgi:threonyl-tRNA synthetase